MNPHIQKAKSHVKRNAPVLFMIGLLIILVSINAILYSAYWVGSKYVFKRTPPHAVHTAPPEQQAQYVVIQWLNNQDPKNSGATAFCSVLRDNNNRFECTAKKFAKAGQPEKQYQIEIYKDGKEWKGLKVKQTDS